MRVLRDAPIVLWLAAASRFGSNWGWRAISIYD
jgi:hypothetical protein